jgi:hypothetical protein
LFRERAREEGTAELGFVTDVQAIASKITSGHGGSDDRHTNGI